MMSSENIPPPSQLPDNNHTTAARKAAPPQKPTQEQQQQQQQQQQAPLKCPRCDSSNTKFCYYNNYSLTQPRHFCKTCRRYWTKGGALRNVPIGGGCRKAKRHKPSPSSSCPTPSVSLSAGPGRAEFRFLAPPTVTPAMDFQLGGISLPRLHPATAGVYTQFVTSSGAHPHSVAVGPGPEGCFSLDLLGMGNYPPIPNPRSSPSSNSSSLTLAGGASAAVIGGDHTISSIESLSSINQEMHWKLQQQRLAMIYGGPSPVEQDDNNQQQHEKSLGGGGINLFKNLECNNKKVVDVTPTEWLFDQIHSNSTANYDNDASNHNIAINNNNNHNNNNHEDFNGVWTTDLHHHHHHQFNGLQ